MAEVKIASYLPHLSTLLPTLTKHSVTIASAMVSAPTFVAYKAYQSLMLKEPFFLSSLFTSPPSTLQAVHHFSSMKEALEFIVTKETRFIAFGERHCRNGIHCTAPVFFREILPELSKIWPQQPLDYLDEFLPRVGLEGELGYFFSRGEMNPEQMPILSQQDKRQQSWLSQHGLSLFEQLNSIAASGAVYIPVGITDDELMAGTSETDRSKDRIKDAGILAIRKTLGAGKKGVFYGGQAHALASDLHYVDFAERRNFFLKTMAFWPTIHAEFPGQYVGVEIYNPSLEADFVRRSQGQSQALKHYQEGLKFYSPYIPRAGQVSVVTFDQGDHTLLLPWSEN